MSRTKRVQHLAPSSRKLRRLAIDGLARRYAMRVRVEGQGLVIERGGPKRGALRSKGEACTDVATPPSVVIARLQLELRAIDQAGLVGYFLLVADCVRYGRSIGAMCVARGAAPGSLLCYLLGISNVDPLRHGLLFERFLNAERPVPPLVFLEVAADRLAEVVEFARKKSGRKPVAHIVTDLETETGHDLPTLGFLGSKALTLIRRTCEQVKQSKGIAVPVDYLPLDDAKTFDLLSGGETSGIFKLESYALRALCHKLQPSCFEHIIAVVALNRPGPMDHIPDFIKRRHGDVEGVYEHPLLESITKETYGVLIYQEQVMQAAQILAGYTLGDADLLRRAMGKRKPVEVERHHQLFVRNAKERNSIPESKANQLFSLLVKFAGYSFAKAHAAAYAKVAYQTAYLKANYSDEFRDAQGEEWDIGFPEVTLVHEIPDWVNFDPWYELLGRKPRTRRVSRLGPAFGTRLRSAGKPSTPADDPPSGSAGIFCLVRYPKGWRLLPVLVDQFPIADLNHVDLWEEIVVRFLAEKWQPEVSSRFPTVAQLHEALLPLGYAFPRGRVVQLGGTFAVHHGNNLSLTMQHDRQAIEASFDIQGNAQWVCDYHEQCIAQDRDRVRELLGLEETWPALSLS